MSTIRFLFAAILLGLVCALLFGQQAQAQERIITTPPQEWTGRVVDVQASPFRACVAGWHRSADRYGGWIRAVAWVDFTRLTSAQIAAISAAFANADLVALAGLRTVTSNAAADPAAAACMAKLGPVPPPIWRVAPLASGQRPAYLLGADGKRGAQAGTAPVLTSTGGPTPCDCRTRSSETTSSTYCKWSTTTPTTVTLCREVKP